jgi:hypothetical protein
VWTVETGRRSLSPSVTADPQLMGPGERRWHPVTSVKVVYGGAILGR